MPLRRRAVIPTIVVLLTFVASVGAADPGAAVVWYRASEECPSGPDFLGKLPGTGARARLAGAGDHIDFVVTLVAADGATQGRLERQTQSGTVAIRELSDASCASVADALALSLGLALEPTQVAPSALAADLPDVAPGASARPPAAPPAAHSVGETRRASVFSRPARRWSVGLDGGVLVGVTPRALSRAAAFVALDPALSGIAADLSVRLAVVGAIGSPTTEVGPIRHWLVAGRGEACPVRLGGSRVGVRPCVGFELGGARASGSRPSGQSASAWWAAPGFDLRAGLAVLPKLGFELGAGALLPLVRSEVDAGAARLYRAEFAVLNAYFGVSVGPF